jgi:hypothetical protein
VESKILTGDRNGNNERTLNNAPEGILIGIVLTNMPLIHVGPDNYIAREFGIALSSQVAATVDALDCPHVIRDIVQVPLYIY